MLNLTFSETVNISSFDEMQLQLQKFPDSNEGSVNITGGTTQSISLTSISLQLTEDNVDAIQLVEDLGNSVSTTYITATNATIFDMNNNPLSPINSTSALAAFSIIGDDTLPQLLNFTFDLNTGSLLLTFSEVVNGLSFNVTAFTLQNSLTPTTMYTLTIPAAPLNSSTEITLILADEDLDAIKNATDLATNISTTFLSVKNMAVLDTSGNPLVEITVDNALQAVEYKPDTTSPELLTFTLDLSNSQLILTFSEIIPVSLFNVNEVFILSNESGEIVSPLSANYTLTTNTREVVIELATVDGDAIKLNPDLGTNVNNTYVNITAGALEDFAGNELVALLNPIQAELVVADNTAPSLTYFNLNLNTGLLTLQFDEPVSMVDLTGFTFGTMLGLPGPTSQLTTSSSVDKVNSSQILVTISNQDLNNLKFKLDLAVNESTTYLLIASAAVQDLSENNIIAMPPPGTQVSTYTPDTTGPKLQAFQFDLNLGKLTITFDEIIDIDTAQESAFMLVNETNGSSSLTLTGSDKLESNGYMVLYITLSSTDLNALKAIRELGVSNFTTYLTATSLGIKDVAGNSMQPVELSEAISASNFTADTTRPQLLQWLIEIDAGNITLIFSETVDVLTSFNAKELDIVGSPSAAPTLKVDISNDTTLPSVDSSTVSITISNSDITNLFSKDLCLNKTECFLSFSANLVKDMAGNPIVPIPAISALEVEELIIDPSPPDIVQFVLFDLDEGVMTLKFTKTIETSSIVFSNITLSQAPIIDPASSTISLTGGSVFDSIGPTITIELSPVDLNNVKKNKNVCQSKFNCYIRYSEDTFFDLASNGAVEVGFTAPGDPKTYPETLIADSTGPEVEEFQLDLDSNTLVIVFDEPIQEFSSTAVTLQNAFNASISHTLSSTDDATVVDNTVTLLLPEIDANTLKSIDTFATNLNNTYLTHTSAIAEDVGAGLSGIDGNPAQERFNAVNSLQAESVTEDLTPPDYADFSEFDLNTGTLTLSFSEPVDLSSIAFDNFTLLSSETSISGVTLTPGSTSYVSSTMKTSISITLSVFDLQAVKLDTGIATSMSNTFLQLAPGAVSDTSGNTFNITQVRMVAELTLDTTPAQLVLFNFDLDIGLLTLSFNDVVDGSTLNYEQITLQNTDVLPSKSVSLTAGPSITTVSDIIEFNITAVDLNTLRGIDDLATTENNTYLRITPLAVTGLDGLNVNSGTRKVNNFTGDETSPTLVEFNLNLGDGTLVLKFSETVNITLLIITEITLQSASNISIAEFNLTLSGGMPSPNTTAADVTITLVQSDLDTIKENPNFGLANSTFLSITDAATYDTVGNPLIGIPQESALNVSEHTIDLIPPQVISYSLDLNSGFLNVTFDETINTNLVSTSGFTLTDAPTPGESSSVNLATSAVVSSTGLFSELSIKLSSSNLNAIKSSESLAQPDNDESTYLAISFGAVQDASENSIAMTDAILANSVIFDSTNPTLTSFSLDLDNGELLLTFNEALNTSSIDVSAVTIQGDMVAGLVVPSVQLNTSTVKDDVTIVLVEEELDGIKVAENLGTDVSDTFVSITSEIGGDYSGNAVVTVSNITAEQATVVINDTTPPVLTNFNLDLNTGMIEFTFSEPVDVSNISYTGISLLSGPSASSVSLTSGNSTSENSRLITVTLSNNDLNEIKKDSILGLSTATTFIAFSASTFLDVSAIPIASVPVSDPKQAQLITPDTTPPQLLSFDFKMDNGTLPLYVVLHFDEVVESSSLEVSKMAVINSFTNSTISFSLSSSTLSTLSIASDVIVTILGQPSLSK